MFLVPVFVSHGFYRLLIFLTNLDKVTPETSQSILGDVAASLILLFLGGGLILYGITGRKHKENS